MDRYVETEEADEYISKYKLESGDWQEATSTAKEIALNEATRTLDRLNWKGLPASSENSFPRGTQTEIPDDIKNATIELAFSYIRGVDPDYEFDNLTVTSKKIGPVSSTSDSSIPKAYVMLGIVSPNAYRLILPYLASRDIMRVERT